jgi:hypothetical protein
MKRLIFVLLLSLVELLEAVDNLMTLLTGCSANGDGVNLTLVLHDQNYSVNDKRDRFLLDY